jgi:ubiquitin carboxyl-terminal hydrolase 20/33
MNRNLNLIINDDVNINDDDAEDTNVHDDNNTRGLVGLKNLGNTCYLNAALQALSNCPSITNFFIECSDFAKSDKIPSLSQHYMKLMQTIWSTNEINTSIAPIDLVQTIKYINPMFKGYAQHDSQEFLLTLLDQLHEELKRLSSTNNNTNNDSILTPASIASKQSDNEIDMSQSDTDSFKSCGSSPSTSDFLSNYETTINGDGPTILFSNERQTSNKSSDSGYYSNINNKNGKSIENELILNPNNLVDKKFIKRKDDEMTIVENENNKTSKKHVKDKKVYSSIISDVFDGKMIGQVQCTGCETISNTIESFQDLSLPIPTKEYLQVIL